MIGGARRVSVFAFAAPVDMRKAFDALSALVAQEMKREILDGEMFLFVSKSRRRAKVLYFDGTGLCLFAKRLEKGRFAALWERKCLVLTTTELALFLEGSDLVGRVALSPAPLCENDLRSIFFRAST